MPSTRSARVRWWPVEDPRTQPLRRSRGRRRLRRGRRAVTGSAGSTCHRITASRARHSRGVAGGRCGRVRIRRPEIDRREEPPAATVDIAVSAATLPESSRHSSTGQPQVGRASDRWLGWHLTETHRRPRTPRPPQICSNPHTCSGQQGLYCVDCDELGNPSNRVSLREDYSTRDTTQGET